LAGSLAALVCSQLKLKVLVVEISKHPRFAIGESTVPTTTAIIDAISKKYNIPELKNLTRYCTKNRPRIFDGKDYPKMGFWFGLHKEGEFLNVNDELLFEALDYPLGPDVHIKREELDMYLNSLYPKYGIDYVDNAKIFNHIYDCKNQIGQVSLKIKAIEEVKKISTRLVLDCTGHSAHFAREQDLLEQKVTSLHTNTRGIYAHFESSCIDSLENVMGGPNPFFRIKRDYTTMHHCFNGGWFWVIPFDDGNISIGLVLDNNINPPDLKLSPEEEFFKYISKFPTVKKHIAKARRTTKFVRKSRLQMYSKKIFSNGVVLSPHSAVFVDPLFSSGILISADYIYHLGDVINKCFKSNNFGQENFEELSKIFYRNVKHIDRIVDSSLKSFGDRRVFGQVFRTWALGSIIHMFLFNYIRTDQIDSKSTGLYGSHYEKFYNCVKKIHETICKFPINIDTAKELHFILSEYSLSSQCNKYAAKFEDPESELPYLFTYKVNNSKAVLNLVYKHLFSNMNLFDKARFLKRTITMHTLPILQNYLTRWFSNKYFLKRLKNISRAKHDWYSTTDMK